MSPISLIAQKYPYSAIPDSLTEGANAVLRVYNVNLTVYSEKQANLSMERVVTVLNKEVLNYAGFAAYYDRFHSIHKLQADIFDKNGKHIKHFSDSDFKDFGNIDQNALYSDVRYRFFVPDYFEFPFTISYQWEIEMTGILSFPEFKPTESPGISLQKAKFRVEYPINESIRIKELNIKTPPVILNNKTTKSFEWTFGNITAIPEEVSQSDYSMFMPTIITAPNKFEIDGYPGDMRSWQTFGLWNYNLKKDLTEIPDVTKEKIKQLTANGTRKEKIKTVYKYMQSRTRYVNVILGIGGWKPASPGMVHRLGYGDCKALSEYTRALLKAAGIDSYYTLIYSDKQNNLLFPDFPYNSFNHVILCVPDGKDTVWLECTSSYLPSAYLVSSTLNRYALLIREDGGHLVRTPVIDHEPAGISSFGTIKIDTSGNAIADLTNKYCGAMYEKRLSFIHNTREENRTDLLKELKMNTMKLIDFGYYDSGDSVPQIKEQMTVSISNFGSTTPKRFIFNPYAISGQENPPFTTKNRHTPVQVPITYYLKDSLTISLPAGSTIEYCPAEKIFESPYGSYKLSIKVNGEQINYLRYFSIREGLYSTEQYKDLWKFLRKVNTADSENIVVKRGN